jgi:hypothetical protein
MKNRESGYVFGGAGAGFLFVVLFVRPPYWLTGRLGDAFITLAAMAFVFGGGYLGFRLTTRRPTHE